MSNLKLQSVTLSNFKAFKDEKTVKLNGQHTLIYGKNGSGKSSLYWGLYTLLNSVNKTDDEIKKYFDHQHEESLIHKNIDVNSGITSIKLNINNNFYELSNQNNLNLNNDSILKDYFYNSDFINYKILNKVFDFRHSEQINLFEWFIESIKIFTAITKKEFYSIEDVIMYGEFMAFHNDYAFRSWYVHESEKNSLKTINSYILEIHDYIIPKINKFTAFFKINIESIQIKNVDNFDIQEKIIYLNNINDQYHHILNNLFSTLQKTYESQKFKYLNLSHFISEDIFDKISKMSNNLIKTYFYDINEFKNINITLNIINGLIPKVLLKINDINRPQSYFNEAKLTIIALCIRLAILKFRCEEYDNNTSALKLLVIDDLLLSLDMEYRMQVADMIFTEFGESHQIIMTTHDKGFYEILKHQFELNNGRCLKIDNNQQFVLDKNNNAITDAEKKLKENNHELVGNSLRKELELMCYKLIWIKKNLTYDDLGYISLDKLINYVDRIILRELFPNLNSNFFNEINNIFKNYEFIFIAYLNNINEPPKEWIDEYKEQFNTLSKCASQIDLNLLVEYIMMIHDIKFFIRRVLNPSSHYNHVPLYEREIKLAIDNIKLFQTYIDKISISN